MKLEILQENLSKALISASRLVSSRPALPILSNILLETVAGRLKISATNLETTLTLFLGAKILTAGSFTLPARSFTELIASLPAGKITLELSEGQMQILSGKSSAKINGIPASEWPAPTEVLAKGGQTLETPSPDFISAVSQTAFSAATDDGRPVLTGVLFLPAVDGGLTLVATDGFRLSQKTLKVAGQISLDSEKPPIIPAKALSEAARLAADSDKISLSLAKNQIIFSAEDVILSSRLIEGNFPAYEKIIPASHTLSVSLSSSDLLRAIRAASIFARDNANIIRFQISDSRFLIQSAAAQVGENQSELDAKITGDSKEEFIIAFNYHYLIDLLTIAGDQEIIVEFSTPLAAALFKMDKTPDFLHLIMPVRVQP